MENPQPFLPQRFLLNRRAFLLRTVLSFGAVGASLHIPAAAAPPELPSRGAVRFGLLTDIHYADRPPQGTRFYRESLPKLREAIDLFNQAKPDFIIQLGDFIDAAENRPAEIRHLQTIEREFARFHGPRHYVLGNHCVWALDKKTFREHSAARAPFYSFDQNGIHFIILDACYRADGVSYGEKNFQWDDSEIPAHEREWLEADLEKSSLPSIIFVHQRLDIPPPYGIKSHERVRQILERSGKVLAVFQGHNHKNELRLINQIHYCTSQALIEGSGPGNNAYSIIDVTPATITLSGFRRHPDRAWTKPRA